MTDVTGGSPGNGSSARAPGGQGAAGIADVLVSVRSALAVMALLALTVLMLEIVRHSERVIWWVLVAGAIAVLLYPVVEFGARWLPRILVVVLLVLVSLGTVGFVSYRIVNDVTSATKRLQVAAPKRAAQLEKNSDVLRQVHLRRRVKSLVDDIPNRLAGGGGTKAIESAATSGVAFVAGLILTIFFLVYGPRIFAAGLLQIRDPKRRARIEHVVMRGTKHGLDYARIKLLSAVVQGLLAYAIARIAGVPGPAALGVWAGLWSLLPIAGVFVGALPIVLFAGASSLTSAIVVALAFVAIGTAEFLVNPRLERETVGVGSFLIVFAAFAGLELDGLTGALLGILGVMVLVGILEELVRDEESEVLTPLRE